MRLARALLEAWLRPQSEAEALQEACEAQRRLDLFDILCQTCGGLGVTEDFTCRWYQCGCGGRFEHNGNADAEHECPMAEMVYGAKRCPTCDGLGSPRV